MLKQIVQSKLLAHCMFYKEIMSKSEHKIPKQYLGAFKEGHRKLIRQYIDDELAWELLKRIKASNWTDTKAIDELTFIAKFNNEYYKNVIKKGDKTALHNTNKLRKDCYDRDNANRRDILSRERDLLFSIEKLIETESGQSSDTGSFNDEFLSQNRDLNHENHIIDLIDEKNKKPKKPKK